jgi:hypothetical protein
VPYVGGIGGVVELLVGPVPLGLDYRVFKVNGCFFAYSPPDGSSCQCVCHATGIIPPSSPFRIWDLFGGEGAAAGFSDGVVEGFEGHVDHAPLIIVIPSRSRRWCAMFGSVWQAWGQ